MKEITVGISDLQFAEYPIKLITFGLGSCVAITLYAADIKAGFMAHAMLPAVYEGHQIITPGKFADTAVDYMVYEMSLKGILPSGMVAKIAGGADMFSGQIYGKGRRIGSRNIFSARRSLESFGIPLVAQDVGGTVGRTVEFTTETGLLTVRTLHGGVKEL